MNACEIKKLYSYSVNYQLYDFQWNLLFWFSMNEMELKYTSFAEHSTPGTFEIYNDVN
jgi:hypothetical protein